MGISYKWRFWYCTYRIRRIKIKVKKLYALGCSKWCRKKSMGRR
jgi:hypothetical protein